jgi:hypothetical protein
MVVVVHGGCGGALPDRELVSIISSNWIRCSYRSTLEMMLEAREAVVPDVHDVGKSVRRSRQETARSTAPRELRLHVR